MLRDLSYRRRTKLHLKFGVIHNSDIILDLEESSQRETGYGEEFVVGVVVA